MFDGIQFIYNIKSLEITSVLSMKLYYSLEKYKTLKTI